MEVLDRARPLPRAHRAPSQSAQPMQSVCHVSVASELHCSDAALRCREKVCALVTEQWPSRFKLTQTHRQTKRKNESRRDAGLKQKTRDTLKCAAERHYSGQTALLGWTRCRVDAGSAAQVSMSFQAACQFTPFIYGPLTDPSHPALLHSCAVRAAQTVEPAQAGSRPRGAGARSQKPGACLDRCLCTAASTSQPC